MNLRGCSLQGRTLSMALMLSHVILMKKCYCFRVVEQ